ncbi:hypothetical protein K488DRAFT_86694 [Vararia minispora EC-137]|uniref:Uncharacterized protein n=1 Tax=Vararia minispora EC-137 TaxID=1314806 RepID=A0ACB8QIT8_9AGAM|nr:hypothetical protein K488DRAFT_86694 [Vararia minispora EC-137]
MDSHDAPTYNRSPSTGTPSSTLPQEPDAELPKASSPTTESTILPSYSSQRVAVRFPFHVTIVIAVIFLIVAAVFAPHPYSLWHSKREYSQPGDPISGSCHITTVKGDMYKETVLLAQHTVHFMLDEDLVDKEAGKSFLYDLDDILRSLHDCESLNWQELEGTMGALPALIADLMEMGLKKQGTQIERRIKRMQELSNLLFTHVQGQRKELDEASKKVSSTALTKLPHASA